MRIVYKLASSSLHALTDPRPCFGAVTNRSGSERGGPGRGGGGEGGRLTGRAQAADVVRRALRSLPGTAHLLYLECCFENCSMAT